MIDKSKYKKVKTPVVLQLEAVECGAAALSIILSYYGLYVPLEKLRQDCGVSRDGSNALSIIKAARLYGMEAKGFKNEPDELINQTLPVIVFWNFNHFLVVEGVDKKYFYLNDPASGRRKVSYSEFNKSFTGVVLTITPGINFKKAGTKPSTLKSLQNKMQGLRNSIIFLVICSLFLLIPGIVLPSFTQIFIDDILVKDFRDWFRPVVIGLIITGLTKMVLTWLQQKYLLRLETRIALSLSSKFIWHILRLPVSFFSQRFAGDINSRISISNRIAQMLSGDLAGTFLNLITIVFFAVILLQYNITLTLIGITISLVNIYIIRTASLKINEFNRKLKIEQGKQIGLSINGLQIIETLKASGTETDFFSKWADSQSVLLNIQQKIGLYTCKLSLISPFLNSLNTALLLGLGSIEVIEGNLTMGELIVFQALMVNFTTPVNSLIDLYSKIQDIQADINRIDDVFNSETDKITCKKNEMEEANVADVKLKGFIEIKNLTFGYNPTLPPLIENFTLELKPGTRVAIVGASGSGKSTISKLISGLYTPWSGTMFFDGIERTQISRKIINNSVALVDQDIFLFEGTVCDNISMWNNHLPIEEIVKAAKDAQIHDDISLRQGTYHSVIAENGKNFSGGQCQRIEIARALAINPSILILDEATSALDASTEKNIIQNIRRRGCTCIIVAHRLSTIRDCDEIIVLSNGKVIQRGTHDELIKIEGTYKNLIKSST